MPGRNYQSSTPYRRGFNGMEKDDEIKGGGNSYDFGARIYDPRLGRFLSRDPLTSRYPFFSPYLYSANNPIRLIDVGGGSAGDPIAESYNNTGSVMIIIAREGESKLDAHYNKMSANGWDYVVVNNIEDANTWMQKTYGKDNSKINNLIITAHGNKRGAMVTNVDPSKPSPYDETTTIYNSDLENYNPKSSTPQNKAISNLVDIGGNLSENAIVTFVDCGAGGNPEFVNSVADVLSEKNGQNITMYSSNGYVGDVIQTNDNCDIIMTNQGQLLNNSMEENKGKNHQWFETKRNDWGTYKTEPLDKNTNVKINPAGGVILGPDESKKASGTP